MKFSYDFLQSFFEKKLPPAKELGDLLMMHFFEVEDIEKVDSDYVLDIDILSSRAGDCLSHTGVAREIAAITGLNYKEPERSVKSTGESIEDRVAVEVKSACSRYTLKGIDDVKVGKSPSFIQKRLAACGIKSINNVVDITNYVMLETGQPLHAFDVEKLEGEKVLVRYAKKREKIVTLDEKRYDLKENILVIADELSPIGIAGIKGGIVPEVDEKTNKIYLEAANFDPVTIRKGSQDLKIRTDASLRFEHGMSPELTKIAAERAAFMIAEIAGGKILKGEIDYYPEKPRKRKIEFDAQEVRRVLGSDISLKEMENILKSLEFKVSREQTVFSVEVPYFRVDVSIKEDIFEEIGRIYGYEKITPSIPKEAILSSEKESFLLKENNCKEIWKGFGFNENYGYSFINEEKAQFFDHQRLIEMEKPVSLEFKYLRPSLLPNLLSNLAENKKNFEKVRLFEIGKTFLKEEERTYERKKIAAVSSSDDFYSMKGKISVFLREFLMKEVDFAENEKEDFLNSSISATVECDGEYLGSFGEISEKMKNEMKINEKVVALEMDFEKLLELRRDVKVYETILKFPPSVRDLAVLVPKKTLYGDVLQKIKTAGGKTLKKVVLFDFYQGKEIPKGTKSFAFRLSFQAKNKTLSSEEVNKVQEKIISTLDKVPEWKVRK